MRLAGHILPASIAPAPVVEPVIDSPSVGAATVGNGCRTRPRTCSGRLEQTRVGQGCSAGIRIALALASMLAAMVIGVSSAAAALPAKGMYSTRAAGQASPYILLEVSGLRRVRVITLEHLRCMSGRLDLMLGIRQRGGSFSVRRRSGMFHVKTGEMLVGRDYSVRGRFTSATTATGSARLISIPRYRGPRCDSGWVRFRVTVMNPVEISISPGPTTLTLPTTATMRVEVVNRSFATSKANRVGLAVRAQAFGTMPLGSPPAPIVSSAQGQCSAPRWNAFDGLESTIDCDLGRLEPGRRGAVTISSFWPLAPSPCDGGIDLTIVATVERATLNEPLLPTGDKEATFELSCGR